MYEKCKICLNAVKSQITVKRFIMFACALLLIIGACQLVDGYLTARGNYHRAIERLEQTQNELNRSRRLNQELKLVIERSAELNSQAGDRIARIEDYQRRTEQGIGRAQSYQQETGRRVGESVANNNRASKLIGESLDIIRRVEDGTKEQPKN
nr:MAG TPA: cell division protein [Caudoviricetes sp.]